MDRLASYARFAMAFALVCLSLALVYFSHALVVVMQGLPETLDRVEKNSEVLEPVLAQTAAIVTLMPQVLDESARIREQVPAILDEMAATRALVPDVLARVDGVRADMPLVLAEVKAVRTETVPRVLAESAAVREQVPPTLTRVEAIVAQANQIAGTMGEEAVSGFLTGLVKTPLNLLSDVGGKLIPDITGATEADRKSVIALVSQMATQGEVGVTREVSNSKTGFSADVTLREQVTRGTQSCYRVNVLARRKREKDVSNDIEICQQQDGSWKLAK